MKLLDSELTKNITMGGGYHTMNSKKKKNIKKIAAAATLCFALASPMVLTGCSEGEVDIGTKWLSGIETPSTSSGKVGDFYLDTDDFKIYQRTVEGWQLVGSIKGQQGETGEDGNDGVGIVSISKISSVNNVDTYSILFSDESTKTFSVTNGTNGADGLTPYVGTNGNWWIGTGSAAVDLGVKAQGEAGKSAYEIYKEANPTSTLTQTEWLESLRGADGKSAYELWKEANPTSTLTQTEWLESLEGETGKSAYELWKAANPASQLTQEQWLAGLKGEQGVGVLRVESEYGFASNGQQCVYFTIYYTNGTHETITAMIPRAIETIEVKNTDIFVLAEDATDDTETGMVLKVKYEGVSDYELVPVTKGMVSGIEDWSVPGNHYDVKVSFREKMVEDVNVNISLNLEEMTLLGTYSAGASLQMMQVASIDVYEEGWARINYMMRSSYSSFCKWESMSEEHSSKITILADLGYNELVLDADATDADNKVVDVCQPTTTPKATYTGTVEMEKGVFADCTIKVFGEGLTHDIYNVEVDMGGGQKMVMQSAKFEPITKGERKFIDARGMIAYLDDAEHTFEAVEYVATVEGEYFADFNDAVEYAIANDKVLTLENTVEVNETIVVDGDLTINLNDYSITAADELAALFRHTAGEFVVDNGYISAKNRVFRVEGMGEGEDARLVLGENLYVDSEEICVFVYGPRASLETSAYLTSTCADYATVSGNGLLEKRIQSIHIKGGRIENTSGVCEAIYAPQTGEIIVEGDAYIEGAVALYIKSGNVTIKNGTFIGNGERQEYKYYGNGSIVTGDAIVIDACNYPGGNPTVTIIDGQFQSRNGGYGIGYYSYDGNKAVINDYLTYEYKDEWGYPVYRDQVIYEIQVAQQWDGTIAAVPTAVNNVIEITSAKQLAGLAKAVNEGNTFDGFTIVLTKDIDLMNIEWTPIGYGDSNYVETVLSGAVFKGTFDGQNHTIYNLKITEFNKGGAVEGTSSGIGLFGQIIGEVKNLAVDGAMVYGNHYVGTIVGKAINSNISNCMVRNAYVNCMYANDDESGDKAGAVVGHIAKGTRQGDAASITNCIVIDSEVQADRDAGQVIGCLSNGAVSENNMAEGNVNVSCNNSSEGLAQPDYDKSGTNITNDIIGRVHAAS